MRAKKCDRCGKLYEHYDGCKDFKSNGNATVSYTHLTLPTTERV